jgi:plasmid maintenance system killer protein
MRLLLCARRSSSRSTLLVHSLHHPSLHAKKYDEANDRWQARVNKNWRFYFKIIGDTYHILKLIPHPKK